MASGSWSRSVLETSDKPSGDDATKPVESFVEYSDKPTAVDVNLTSFTKPTSVSKTDKHSLSNVLLVSKVEKIKKYISRLNTYQGLWR